MLMSYVYFASVLYMAVQPRKSDLKWKVISRSNNNRSLNQRLTWLYICSLEDEVTNSKFGDGKVPLLMSEVVDEERWSRSVLLFIL